MTVVAQEPLVVLDVVALTPALLAHAPGLARLAQGGTRAAVEPVFPALTCPVQSTFLTGKLPREHGIVGNGWYFRDLSQVWLWRQSNRLVTAEKVWEKARAARPGLTCAKLFWWYNMYSSADVAVTPRPAYLADGRKLPDLHTRPAGLAAELQAELGRFPLFRFWGPAAGIESSRWIAAAALGVFERFRPDLTLVYLPHLDYDLQRYGPADPRIPAQVAALDQVAAGLAGELRSRGARVVVLSEYGIEPVEAPIEINRLLRRGGWLALHEQLGRELLDAGASRAFAVADHQVAHVYVAREEDVPAVRDCLAAGAPGIELLDRAAQAERGLDHPRSGELVAVAPRGRWFSYPWWLEDERAPDFARTVDIHNKPGYDPLELFLDPQLAWPAASIGWRMLRSWLGQRTVFDLVPLDGRLVRGSHGRLPERPEEGPVLLSHLDLGRDSIRATEVCDLLLELLVGT